MPDIDTPGLSRRDVIRRSAIIGGSLVWATPAIQSLTTPAFAGTPGEAGCPDTHTFVRLKFSNEDGSIEVSADSLGNSCDWPDYESAPLGHVSHIVSAVLSADEQCLAITFDEDCDAKLATVLVKSGSKEGFCVENPSTDVSGNTLTVCLSGQQISYVAILVCCAI
jgi:hypothetical protein